MFVADHRRFTIFGLHCKPSKVFEMFNKSIVMVIDSLANNRPWIHRLFKSTMKSLDLKSGLVILNSEDFIF